MIFDDDFIEMPFVARPGPAPAQPVGVDLPGLRAPLPDGFVADHDAALQHQLLDLTKAQRNRCYSHTQCAMISGGYRCPLYDDDAAVTTTDLGSDQASV